MEDILEALGLNRKKRKSRDVASLIRSVPDEEKSLEHDRFIPERFGTSDSSGGCRYSIRQHLTADEYAAQCEFLEEELPPFLQEETGDEYTVVTNHPISIPVGYSTSRMRKVDLLVVPEQHADPHYLDDEIVAGITVDTPNIWVKDDDMEEYFESFAPRWDAHLDETVEDKAKDVYVG